MFAFNPISFILNKRIILVKKNIRTLTSQGHNFYKLKYISLEEDKIVPFQQ